jgi:tripartite-type tricarboxylate transporter receptor subunit TctC
MFTTRKRHRDMPACRITAASIKIQETALKKFSKGLALVAWAAFALVASQSASAQSWPNKPIRIVVPFTAGGNTDIVARMIGERLSKTFGQPFLIENKPGAAGLVGATAVAKAPADGYTFLMGTVGTHAINAALYAKMPYDTVKDFTPVTLVASVPNILVVHPSLPVNSVKDLIGYLKANPDKANFASSGSGTSIHLSGELFKIRTGVAMTHIAYKGSPPALSDLMGGQVQLMFDNLPTSLPYVKAGKLKALAVTTSKRIPALPNLPTVAESGLPGFETGSWFGLLAPAGTPKEIITALDTEIRKMVQSPEMREKLIQQGAEPVGMGSDEFAAHIKSELAKWGEVVKASGARAD